MDSADSTDSTGSGEFSEGGLVAVTPVEVLHETQELRLERQRYRFEGLTGQAFRVRLPRTPSVRVAPAEAVVDFEALLPKDPGPWAAINGGFYAANTPGDPYEPMGLVVSRGVEHHALTRNGGSGIFLLDEGRPRIVHRSDYAGRAREAVQSIDRIISKGESLVKPKAGARSAARSAVVVGQDHLWLVALAADGSLVRAPGRDGYQLRSTAWQGLPLWAFAEYLRETTDVVDALNLDGAVSTQLAVRDGEYRFELRGERGTVNAIVVRP